MVCPLFVVGVERLPGDLGRGLELAGFLKEFNERVRIPFVVARGIPYHGRRVQPVALPGETALNDPRENPRQLVDKFSVEIFILGLALESRIERKQF